MQVLYTLSYRDGGTATLSLNGRESNVTSSFVTLDSSSNIWIGVCVCVRVCVCVCVCVLCVCVCVLCVCVCACCVCVRACMLVCSRIQ